MTLLPQEIPKAYNQPSSNVPDSPFLQRVSIACYISYSKSVWGSQAGTMPKRPQSWLTSSRRSKGSDLWSRVLNKTVAGKFAFFNQQVTVSQIRCKI